MCVWRNMADSAHKIRPCMQKQNEYLKKGRKENSSGDEKKKYVSKKVCPWPAEWRNPLEGTLAILSEK